MPTPKSHGQLNSIPKTRERLGGICHETFYNLVRSGHLKTVKVRKRTFVSDAEIDRFIDEGGTR